MNQRGLKSTGQVPTPLEYIITRFCRGQRSSRDFPRDRRVWERGSVGVSVCRSVGVSESRRVGVSVIRNETHVCCHIC